MTVSLAVWGVSLDEPVEIRLDGKVIKKITEPGYYVVSEKVIGTHHIAVLCRYKVFEETVFYAVPPPSPPPTIPLAEFMRRLKEQREAIITRMSLAAAAGVPLGIYTKKKTKIRTDWVYPMPAAMLFIGYWRMPDLYWLIPLGLAHALAYTLCRDYADFYGLMRIQEGLGFIEFSRLPVDVDGDAILAISPRYWRRGFMLKKHVVLEDVEPLLYRHEGEVINCIPYKAKEETEESIRIVGDPELSRLLIKKGVLEEANEALRKAMRENIRLRSARVLEAWKINRRALRELFRALAAHGFEVEEKPLRSPLKGGGDGGEEEK
ncbi:MAG: hypothetical protein J7K49_04955 [Thaumarchaeota archaeon]|nr:hypothetical protein [Nitrososphaerota archaeon]